MSSQTTTVRSKHPVVSATGCLLRTTKELMAKILLVDDEEAILKMYGSALGEDVITAKDGDEAIEKAGTEKPDLILLDIIMPKENGLDVLKKLKSDDDTKGIPIIVLTNLPKEASAQKAKALGASGYYVKAEYEPITLAKEIEDLLN